jgi:hypothetical protein
MGKNEKHWKIVNNEKSIDTENKMYEGVLKILFT